MKQEVHNTVQAIRKKRGVTQGQFADSIGVSRQTVVAIEKGNYTPSVLLALRIANYFSVSVEELFTIK